MYELKYPSATVLLDLTASTESREEVAILIQEYDLIPIINFELKMALQEYEQQPDLNLYKRRYRDLMIGILLNLSCNIEYDSIQKYLIENNVIEMLTLILVDDRHSWPGNGAALALLQYSHQALSN